MYPKVPVSYELPQNGVILTQELLQSKISMHILSLVLRRHFDSRLKKTTIKVPLTT